MYAIAIFNNKMERINLIPVPQYNLAIKMMDSIILDPEVKLVQAYERHEDLWWEIEFREK